MRAYRYRDALPSEAVGAFGQVVCKIGSKLRILIGKDLTLGKPLKLQAGVVRCIRSPGENGRSGAEIGVKLLKAGPDSRAITSLLDRFKSPDGSVSAYAPTNMLIITDTGRQVRRMLRMARWLS